MTKDNDEKEAWERYTQSIKRLGPNATPSQQTKKNKMTLHAVVQSKTQESKSPDPAPETKIHESMESLLSQRGPTALDVAQQEKKKNQKTPLEDTQPIIPPVLMVSQAVDLLPPSKAAQKEPLDLRVERNLSLGDVVVEARVDLHGLTEQEAHENLIGFLGRAYQRGRRVVLVITGKGIDNGSILRQNLPRWCDVAPLSHIVLAIRCAAAHHGGDGAYYVVLRKQERTKEKKHGL